MTIGFIAGAWDLLHPGHVLAISTAKSCCDVLVVGLHSDPSKERKEKNSPVQSIFERWVQLTGILRNKDVIVPYDTEDDLLNILNSYDIDIRFLDCDYMDKEFTGKYLNIPTVFINRDHTFSSTSLRNRLRKTL